MKNKLVMTIRLSPTWTKMGSSTVRDLARYLYSFYSFLQLSDPFSRLAWAIGTDKEGGTFLVIFEVRSNGEEDESDPPTLTSQDFETDLDIEMEIDGDQSEDDWPPETEPDRWDARR